MVTFGQQKLLPIYCYQERHQLCGAVQAAGHNLGERGQSLPHSVSSAFPSPCAASASRSE